MTIRSTFNFADEQKLFGDKDRLQQVLLNLMSNARKYVPKERGLINIEVTCQKTEGQWNLKISVTDNGPGIS